jgi:hypothetical protein
MIELLTLLALLESANATPPPAPNGGLIQLEAPGYSNESL